MNFRRMTDNKSILGIIYTVLTEFLRMNRISWIKGVIFSNVFLFMYKLMARS